MTRATAPVAAEIIAGRPPTKAIVTAMVKEANRPIRGSTPAMIENEIASGISASATTRPAEDLGPQAPRRAQRGAHRGDLSLVGEGWCVIGRKGCQGQEGS